MSEAPYASQAFSDEQVCICTGVQRKGPALAVAINRAAPSKAEIEQAFAKHLESDTLVLTDGRQGYSVLESSVEGCLVVNVKKRADKVYHMNTVNNFHCFIKNRIANFRGVATKYLNRYNGLFSVTYRGTHGTIDMLSPCMTKPGTVSYWTSVADIKLRGVLVLSPST